MKRRMGFVVAWVFFVVVAAQAGQVRIVQQEQFDAAGMSRSGEAVLAVENNDQNAYYVTLDDSGSILVLNPMGQGPSVIPPGSVTYLVFDGGGTWGMVGDGGQRLDFSVVPNEVTTLMLEPFGAQAGTGLLGIVGRIPNRRSATLFGAGAEQAAGVAQPGVIIDGYPGQYPGGVVYPAPPPPPVYEYHRGGNIGDMVTDIVGDVMDEVFDSRHDRYRHGPPPHRRGGDGLEFHLNID